MLAGSSEMERRVDEIERPGGVEESTKEEENYKMQRRRGMKVSTC